MAKRTSKQPVSNDKTPSAAVEDAEIIEEISSDTPAGESPEDITPQDEAKEAVQPEPEQNGSDGDNPYEELFGTETAEQAAMPVAPTIIERKSGGVSGLVGGAVAAVLGFVLAQIVPNGWPVGLGTDELKQQISVQDKTIIELRDRIETLQGGLEAFASADAVESLAQKVEGDVALALTATETRAQELTAKLGENLERIEALERRPINESTDEAVAAAVRTYNEEVAALRAEIEAQLDETKALLNNTAEKERLAELAAKRAAEARALLQVQTGIETGEDYTDALNAIESVETPDVLADLSGSVPTLAELTDALPALAREALQASRAAQESDSTGDRLGTFLQRQLGVRSLAPQEGDSANAVLSRIEAAARAGDLGAAIAEADALPDPAKAVLADWLAQAETRQTALKAADDLAQSLTSN